MTPVFSRKSFLFLVLGVFALLFGVAQSVSAATCASYGDGVPTDPEWQKSDITCTLYFDDAGGSTLKECSYEIKSNGILTRTGSFTPAEGCTGDGPFEPQITVSVVPTTGNCRDIGTDKCSLIVTAKDNSDNTTTTTHNYDIDYSPPLDGSISYTDGFSSSTIVYLTVNDGIDADSGINTATRAVERKSATLSNGTCGAYGLPVAVSFFGTYPNLLSAGLVSGNCYQYQYLVKDNIGNQATYTSSSTVKVDRVAPRVDAFDVTPKDPAWVNIATPNAVISWTVSDTGGSGIQKHEVWRAPDSGGIPGAWVRIIDNAVSPAADNPADGTYWYGLHVKDNAENCIKEDTSGADKGHCGGVSFDGLDTRPDRGPIKVIVDKTAPTLAQVTAVPSPTNDTTPNYTFSSTEAGAIAYGGDCSSATTAATSGSNTVTFNALAQGVHSNCTVRVTDAASNPSSFLNVNSFTIDTTAPNTTITDAPSSPSFSSSASFSFTSTESGTFQCQLDSGGFSSCTSPKSYTGLSQGPHTFQVKATDTAGNEDPTPASHTWIVTLNQAPTIQGNPSDSPDPIKANAQITFSVNWNDPDAGDLTKIHICKTNAISGQTCSGGSWCDSAAFSSTSPASCSGTSPSFSWPQNYYAFVCDDENACSASKSGTFLVDTKAPTITTFTITPQSPSWANNASPNITVTWNVSDQGSSHLDKVRVYRAPFDSIDPDRCDDTNKLGCVWTPVGSDVAAPPNSDNWNCPSCVTDTPGSGTWWYGMHVWDKAQNETVEPTPPGVKKALVDTAKPSAAVTSPTAGTWFKDNFTATLDDSDTGGSGLVAGASGCQYRFIGDNPSGSDVSSGDRTRACDLATKTVTVGPAPDVCRFEGTGRCRVETQSFDAAGNASGWQTMLFGVDFTVPKIGVPSPATAQAGIIKTYSASLTDAFDPPTTGGGKISGCSFYWKVLGGIWSAPIATTVDPIPCENGAACTVSADHMFASPGQYDIMFACADSAQPSGTGYGVNIVTVDSLSVALSAVPSPGGSVNTLFDLTANTAGSTMTGDTTYGFDCRIDTGDCTADGNFADCDLSTTTLTGVTSYTAADLCQYPVTAGTYTAKVAVQRGVGTAQDTVAIGPITTNSDPTTTVRSVDTPNATDYCGVTGYPPVRVRWTFSDADPGDTQGAYELEVFRVSDGVKVVDTGKKPGATQEYVFQSAGEQLLWSTSYTWQVKVWDNHDAASAFIAGPGFTTIAHYYPVPNFTWSPAFPSAEELIQFTDQTNFAAGATGKTWSWDFDNSNGIQIDSSLQNPTHTYAQIKAYGVTLQATDNVGSCSAAQSVNVAVPFPEWQEISPF